MLNVDSIVQREPEIIVAGAGEDLVMVSVDNGFYYGVTDVARDIWEAIETPTQVSDLVERLVSTYDIEKAVCVEQTLSFLEELAAERLLKVMHEPSA